MAGQTVDISALEERIGYTFKDKGLLVRALTHPSYGQVDKRARHNQRMEFLGDAVLGFVIAEELFNLLPEEREGILTRYRSILVRGKQLSTIAREINLGQFLRLGDSEDAVGGRELASILEDAFEAVFAAVYLDSGIDAVRQVVRNTYKDMDQRLEEQMSDLNPKGKLQELLQPRVESDQMDYRLSETTGPDHRKCFSVELWIEGECRGRGSGHSKKLAEEAAAREALEEME